MTNENKRLEELKREAVQQAKETARLKMEEKKKEEATKEINLSEEEIREIKRKAVAEAKERAAKLKEEKLKNIQLDNNETPPQDKTQETNSSQETTHQQKQLRLITEIIHNEIGNSAIITASINSMSKELPTIEIDIKRYYEVMEQLKIHSQLQFDNMHEIHGTDFIDYFEIYVHLFSYKYTHQVAIKVKIDKQNPKIPSITTLWAGANWPEREAFDLLGITFEKHPNLKRILLPDDWVGHPLRKDYEPYDEEV